MYILSIYDFFKDSEKIRFKNSYIKQDYMQLCFSTAYCFNFQNKNVHFLYIKTFKCNIKIYIKMNNPLPLFPIDFMLHLTLIVLYLAMYSYFKILLYLQVSFKQHFITINEIVVCEILSYRNKLLISLSAIHFTTSAFVTKVG